MHTLIRAKSLPSCLTLCDPTDCSPPSSSVHVILQARILEWVAIPFSIHTHTHTHTICKIIPNATSNISPVLMPSSALEQGLGGPSRCPGVNFSCWAGRRSREGLRRATWGGSSYLLAGTENILEWQLLSHAWLCNPKDCSLPGSSVHGTFWKNVLIALTRIRWAYRKGLTAGVGQVFLLPVYHSPTLGLCQILQAQLKPRGTFQGPCPSAALSPGSLRTDSTTCLSAAQTTVWGTRAAGNRDNTLRL